MRLPFYPDVSDLNSVDELKLRQIYFANMALVIIFTTMTVLHISRENWVYIYGDIVSIIFAVMTFIFLQQKLYVRSVLTFLIGYASIYAMFFLVGFSVFPEMINNYRFADALVMNFIGVILVSMFSPSRITTIIMLAVLTLQFLIVGFHVWNQSHLMSEPELFKNQISAYTIVLILLDIYLYRYYNQNRQLYKMIDSERAKALNMNEELTRHLEKNQLHIQSIIYSIDEIIVEIDSQSLIRGFWNPIKNHPFETIQPAIGDSIYSVVDRTYENLLRGALSEVTRNKRSKLLEIQVLGKQTQLRINSIQLDDQEPYLTVVFQDITRMVTLEKQGFHFQKFEKSILDFASRMSDIHSMQHLSEALEILLNGHMFTKVYLYENFIDNGEMFMRKIAEAVTDEKYKSIHDPVYQRMAYGEFSPDFYELLSAGKNFGGIVSKMNETDRRVLTEQGVRSLQEVPIFVDSSFYGFVGFEDAEHEYSWSEYEISLLRVIAAQIAQFIKSMKQQERYIEDLSVLEEVVRHQENGIITIDSENRVILYNRKASDITGYREDDAVQQNINSILSIVDFRIDLSSNETHQLFHEQFKRTIVTKIGERRMVNVNISPLSQGIENIKGAVITFNDITIQEKIDQELHNASKFQSLGLIAGGIAHDFNNYLTTIMGKISALETENPSVLADVNQAMVACQRAKKLADLMLTFSKGGLPALDRVNLVDLLKRTLSYSLFGTQIKYQLNVPEEINEIVADKNQFEQVIYQLIINSIQSMPDGGDIEITAENVSFDEDFGLGIRPGNYVHLVLNDNGLGIPKSKLEHILEATTASVTEVAGLGLVIAQSIIEKHHGVMSIRSTENNGTQVDLYLPASKERRRKTSFEDVSVGRELSVLVMDDDIMICDLIKQLLERLNMSVTITHHADEATEAYRQHMAVHKFDLVILDLTIPGGKGGVEAIKMLKQIDPDVRAIVSSGYSHDPVLAKWREYGFVGNLPKPYTFTDLKTIIADVLSDA